MQEKLRSASEDDFQERQKFRDRYEMEKITDPRETAEMWELLGRDLDNGSVVDLRKLD